MKYVADLAKSMKSKMLQMSVRVFDFEQSR